MVQYSSVQYSAVVVTLECTVYSCTLYNVVCKVLYLTVHCEVQYSLLEGKSGPVSRFVQRSVYSVMCIVCCAQCEALYVQCDMCSAVVSYPVYSV